MARRAKKGGFGGAVKVGVVAGLLAVAYDQGALPDVGAVADAAPAMASIGGGASAPAAGFSAEQMGNANIIVAVGQDMGVPEQGQVVAIATAIQESGLRNLDYGDRDSLGLFQQRPSQGWGSPAQVTDPEYSARQFYEHLLAVPGWQGMPVTVAAQTVQRSCCPDAYAAHEQEAHAVVAATS